MQQLAKEKPSDIAFVRMKSYDTAWATTLEPKDRKAFLRALLYPGRFCYSWMTGFMGSNDDAVAFLAKTRPARLDVSLITRALQCRHADADPDVLFPARTRLPSQVDACATLLAGVPLTGRSNARGRR